MTAPAPSAAPAEFIPVENGDLTGDDNSDPGGKLEPTGTSDGSVGIGSTAYILIGAGSLVLIGSALYLRRRKPESTEAAEGDESTDASPPATNSAVSNSVV